MKIVTWNVNGIRSLKKNINNILTELDSDVSCFQETKVSRSLLQENVAIIDGYSSYFSYPRKQSGYSGVATYCRDTYVPEDAEEGLSGILKSKNSQVSISNFSTSDTSMLNFSDLDSEGRVIITYHLIKYGDEICRTAIINVYCPRVDPEKPERHLYKMQFCHLLEAKTKELCNQGCFVIIVGDLNIARSIIDHCDPGDEQEFNNSEARQWLNEFLSRKISSNNGDVSIIDTFRHCYPDKKNAYTCWNVKTGARLTNYGTRIDYILISDNLLPLLIKCEIMSDYEGSDHCPVFVELKCESICEVNAPLPAICTRLWPEFSGRQQTLQLFLKKTESLADNLTKNSEENINSVITKERKKKNKQKSITNFFKSSTSSTVAKNTAGKMCSFQEVSDSSNISSQSYFNNNSNVTDSDIVSNSGEDISSSPKSSQAAVEWKSMLRGPPKPPLCVGHKKETVLRTVKKKGPNYGRQFFMCAQPAGHSSNPDANCNFFKWVSVLKTSNLKPS